MAGIEAATSDAAMNDNRILELERRVKASELEISNIKAMHERTVARLETRLRDSELEIEALKASVQIILRDR